VNRLPRPVAFGQVTPLDPGSHPVQDAVDHLSMIAPPPAAVVARG
jgi:hypothetical protein